MKTIALLAFVLCLPACTADVFTLGDDAGPTTDAAARDDADPSADAGADASTADTDSGVGDAEKHDSAVDSAVDTGASDTGPDAKDDAAVVPACAPIGTYKVCPSSQHCIVTASDGASFCTTPAQNNPVSCSSDSDCFNGWVCALNTLSKYVCLPLCQWTVQTPWGPNATTYGNMACGSYCSGGSGGSFQLPRLPSWLGVCKG